MFAARHKLYAGHEALLPDKKSHESLAWPFLRVSQGQHSLDNALSRHGRFIASRGARRMVPCIHANTCFAQHSSFLGLSRFLAPRPVDPAVIIRREFELLATGAAKGLSAMFAFHVGPMFKYGTLLSRPGVLLAGVADFDVRITGVGGHAAMPNLARDPILASSAIVLALQVKFFLR